MNTERVITLLLGTLVTISLGLATWAIKATHDTAIRLALIEATLESIAMDHADDARQDDQIRKFWRLHGWTRDEINRILHDMGEEPISWPDLD